MLGRPLLNHILRDEALTRGLGDPEAHVLVEWVVDQAERLTETATTESAAWAEVRKLCHRCRAIARFVLLWCYLNGRGAAAQLAATERFAWPLPTTAVDPYELMRGILSWEASLLENKVHSESGVMS